MIPWAESGHTRADLDGPMALGGGGSLAQGILGFQAGGFGGHFPAGPM